jgi:signal transduction histidine kinase
MQQKWREPGPVRGRGGTWVAPGAGTAPDDRRHKLRGFRVHWIPSGERVLAQGDHVAEVVNVLLENAFHHAAGAGARVHTRRIDGVIEIAVADSGPVIDRSARPRIFEWGERSNGSSGSGIGLNVAKQLTVELEGYLRLVDSPASGATFVPGLPAEERS